MRDTTLKVVSLIHFTILIHSIHEHGKASHLLVSSFNVYFSESFSSKGPLLSGLGSFLDSFEAILSRMFS